MRGVATFASNGSVVKRGLMPGGTVFYRVKARRALSTIWGYPSDTCVSTMLIKR
jgi:hypothetical protein